MASTDPTVGISHGGKSAEQRYRELTGAAQPPKAGYGDAELGGTYIEVKKATAATLNQVRAVKYIPLVAYHVPTDTWYVVPAHIVVCLVSSKGRGQHTENPFESATLNIFSLGKYKCAEAELRERTLQAIAEAQKHSDLKIAMDQVLASSKDLSAKSVADVTACIAKLKIEP